jgi:predicted nucleotidyltransferase
MTIPTHLKYLIELAQKLKLTTSEAEGIQTSVTAIINKLKDHFKDDGLKEVFAFGSYDRNTLITRKADTESDVDILIVFDEKRWEAQTYLNKLKDFAQTNYPRSEAYQAHPTITIELLKIKFELVPCIYKEEFFEDGKYLIPNPGKTEFEWIKTEPFSLKDKINNYKNTRPVLIDLILLYKHWNIQNGRPYSTFTVETFLLEHFDYEEDLCYNFYRIIDMLHFNNPEKEQNDISTKAKKMKNDIENLIHNGKQSEALIELAKIVPEIN